MKTPNQGRLQCDASRADCLALKTYEKHHPTCLRAAAVLWFSPEEIATLLALDARAAKIADVKVVFPGAEIVEINRTDRAIDFPLEGED